MEQYIKQFRDIVLKFLVAKAAQYKLPIHKVALCFYLGHADQDKTQLGAGYFTALNVIHKYVIKTVFEEVTYYLEAKRDEETGKYNYDWTAKMSNEVANYPTEEAAQKVIEAFGFKDAEVVYAGDSRDFYKWVETFPEQPKVEKKEMHLMEHTSIEEIIKSRFDILNMRGKFHGIIMASLVYVHQANNIEDINTRVYAVPNEEGKNIDLYIFDGDKFKGWIDINDLVTGAFLSSQAQAQQQ